MTAHITYPEITAWIGRDADSATLNISQRERDEAAHTVSIWNSDKRGTGARRIVAVGIVKDGYGDTFTRRNEYGAGFSSNGHTEF